MLAGRTLLVEFLSKFHFPQFLSFHYFIVIDLVKPGALCLRAEQVRKRKECAELVASVWQASSLILVVPLEVKK